MKEGEGMSEDMLSSDYTDRIDSEYSDIIGKTDMNKHVLPKDYQYCRRSDYLVPCKACGKYVEERRPAERYSMQVYNPESEIWILCAQCYEKKVAPRVLQAWKDAIIETKRQEIERLGGTV